MTRVTLEDVAVILEMSCRCEPDQPGCRHCQRAALCRTAQAVIGAARKVKFIRDQFADCFCEIEGDAALDAALAELDKVEKGT